VADLGPVFEGLLRSDVGGPEAEVDRDRPARQRLNALTQRVITWSQQQRRGDELAAVSALGEVLSQQQDYLGTGLELVVWSMPIDDSITERLDRLGAMIDDRPLTAHALAGALLTRLREHHVIQCNIVAYV
jgi:hypothetical protein